MNVDTCPDPDLLSSHLLGKVQGEQAETIDRHLSSCQRCLESVRQLHTQDDLTAALQAGGPQLPVSEDVLAGIIERGKRLPQALHTTSFGDVMDVGSRGQEPGTPSDVRQRQSDFARDALEEFGLGQRSPELAGGDDDPPHLPRFRIERLLGQGGFGKVYLARDEQLQRPVAVKVLHCRLMSQLDNAQAYLHEARAVANLDHPNIVPVFDVGSAEHCPYYVVSKYVEGSDLATLIQRTRLTYTESADLVATVAEALHYAHQRGLVHRDVKPGNILVDSNGQPYVVDFGLALREEHFGEGPRFLGTPPYLSPEQARGEGHRVDARADIYGLGAVMYEMLTGRPIFEGKTRSELLEQIAAAEPVPPRQIDDSIPAALERICCKAIAKRVGERYSSADLMAEDLRCFLAEQAATFRDAAVVSVARLAAETHVAAIGSTEREPAGASPVVRTRIREGRAEGSPDAGFNPIEPHRSASLLQGPLLKIAAGVLILLGTLGTTEATGVTSLNSTVIRLVTGSGTLVIETDDPGVMITIDGEEVTIRGGGVEEFTLRPGKHQVAAIRGNQPAKQELVTITRNGRTSVRMSLESGEAIARSSDARSAGPGHREGSADDSPNAPTLKKTLVGHTSSIYTVVYSPNGRWLASTGEGEVFVWDMQSGELAYALPVQKDARFTAITVSPDGQFLLTAPLSAPAPISIWEAATGKPAGVLEGHAEGLYDLSFSPDGQTLVSGGHESFVRMWDFPGRRKLRDIPSDSRWVRSAIFSSKGQVAFGQDRVFLAEADGKIFKTINKYAGPLCFSPDGRRLAGTTWQQGLVTVWNVDTGKEIASWRAHGETAEGLAFSRDGNVLATAGGDARVRLWDWQSQRQLAELSHDLCVNWVAFSPDRVTLATAARDRLIKLWDVSAIVAQRLSRRAGGEGEPSSTRTQTAMTSR